MLLFVPLLWITGSNQIIEKPKKEKQVLWAGSYESQLETRTFDWWTCYVNQSVAWYSIDLCMHMIQSYTYLTGNKFAHESSVFKDNLRRTSVFAKNELFCRFINHPEFDLAWIRIQGPTR